MDTVIALLILGGLTGSIVGVHRWRSTVEDWIREGGQRPRMRLW